MSRAQGIRDLIEQNRQQIAEMEREIGRLATQDHRLVRNQTPYGAIKLAIPEKIADLGRKIEALQRQLPMIETTEQITANANAKLEAAERERATARVAERNINMKEAARQNYLSSGGSRSSLRARGREFSSRSQNKTPEKPLKLHFRHQRMVIVCALWRESI